MAIKSSALSKVFFEEPPYYEHEVLANLEEFNLKSDANSQSNNNNFAKVLSGLDKSAESIVSTISDESERSRIEAQINAEKIEAGISETNYNLLDISYGISNLEDSMKDSAQELKLQVRKSSEDIVKQIRQSGEDITDQLEITNNRLSSIDNNLLTINESLKGIGSILSIILKKISKPNEVQAIELADQSRISLAIGKNEEALRVTRKAMELCGTSITVTAYHLMTLSLFSDKELIKESEEVYKDFVNLITFKLFDGGSDTQSVRDEIYYVAYPALFALSRTLGGKILNETQRLYSSISGDKTATNMLLTKPLKDKSTEVMTLHPSPLRELHWTVILKEEIIANKAFDKLASYIPRVARNNILIKNELLIIANKELLENKVLRTLLYKTWHEDTATDEELECINIFISMQPQHNINIDNKTLLLIDRYVSKYELPISSELKVILEQIKTSINKNIKDNYLDNWGKYEKELGVIESNELVLLKEKTTSFLNNIEKDIASATSSNSSIGSKASAIKKEIVNLENQVSGKRKEVGLHEEHSVMSDGTYWGWSWFIAITIGFLIHYFNNSPGLTAWGIIQIPAATLLPGLPVGLFVAWIFKLISGGIHDYHTTGATNRKSDINSLNTDISNLRNKSETLTRKNTDTDSLKNEMDEKYHNQLVTHAKNNVAKPLHDFMLKLKKHHDVLITDMFFKTADRSKTEKEISRLISNNFPNRFALSTRFNDKFHANLSKFKNPNEYQNSLLNRLLFNKNISINAIDSDPYEGTKLSEKVIIVNTKNRYSSRNQSDDLDWPNKELKYQAGKNYWGNWRPSNGDKGLIIHNLTDGSYRTIHIVDINGYFVPFQPEGVKSSAENI